MGFRLRPEGKKKDPIVCVLYSSLYFAERDGLPQRSGLVQIPLLPGQVIRRNRSSPVMPLEMTRRPLFLVFAEVTAA